MILKTQATVEKADGDSFTAIASTEAIDRHGESVSVEGWQLKNYKDNPILLFMHDHSKPIGKATRVWIEKASGKPKLMFKGVISEATEISRAAKQLMTEGVMNTFSVGFRPLEMDDNVITKSELFEISLVSVPANPEARLVAMKSLQEAKISEEVINELMPKDPSEIIAELNSTVDELKKEVEAAKDLAELAVKGLQHLAPQQRSIPDAVQERLRHSKVIAKTAEKLIGESVSSGKSASRIKLIKQSSEKLIVSLKKDLK